MYGHIKKELSKNTRPIILRRRDLEPWANVGIFISGTKLNNVTYTCFNNNLTSIEITVSVALEYEFSPSRHVEEDFLYCRNSSNSSEMSIVSHYADRIREFYKTYTGYPIELDKERVSSTFTF